MNRADRLQEAESHRLAGRSQQALEIYDELLSQHPRWAVVVHLKGILLVENKQAQQGLALLWQSVELQPLRAEFWRNLAALADKAQEPEQSLRAWQQAYRIEGDAAALVGWAGVLAGLGRFDEALKLLNKAGARYHDDRNLMYAAARFAYYAGDWEQAEQWITRLLARDPADAPTQFVAASVFLGLNRYREGFEAMEWRWKGAGDQGQSLFRNDPQLMWTDQPSQGRHLLLWHEQGLGDSLNFVRFAPLLARQFANVSLHVPIQLYRLFQHSFPGLAVLLHAPGQYDYHLPLMSLGHRLGVNRENLWPGPYLKAPLHRGFAQRLASEQRLKVGLCWAGNVYGAVRPGAEAIRRNTRLIEWVALAHVKNVAWVSLQLGEGMAELAASPLPMQRFDDELEDFADTVELVQSLDLVIAVDSAVAHAAAASGKEVWLLARVGGDWRWGRRDIQTPWYPTMRVFHQQVPGLWRNTLEKIAAELEPRASARLARDL